MTIDIDQVIKDARDSAFRRALRSDVFVWIDLDCRAAVELAARCRIADRGGSEDALVRLYEKQNDPVSFWMRAEVAGQLLRFSIPEGSSETIRILTYDSHGTGYREVPR